jgi:hypothetical protein
MSSEYLLLFRNTGWHKDLSPEEILQNMARFTASGLEFGQTVEVRAIVAEPDEFQIAREKMGR